MLKKEVLLFVATMLTGVAFGQQGSLDDIFKVDYETPLTLDLEDPSGQEELIAPVTKKKKKKKKVFFGIKTKRGFTRNGFGNKVVFELFHYLKVYEDPPEYARDYFWYDSKKRKIINSTKVRKKDALILHGHYVKKQGDQVLEEGYFYKGQKHGRWVRLNSHDILQDKKKYWKGWPEESLLAFYDFDRERVREVIPVHFGERNGTYYAFHRNGNVAARGEYKFNHRVGLWREFYPNKATKREIKYSEDPFDFETSPVILKEWDERGQLIYDRRRFLTQID